MYNSPFVAWWCNGLGVGLVTQWSVTTGHRFDSQLFRFQVATLGEFLAHVPLSPSSIILQWFVHLQAHGLRKGDEHPAYTLLEV